MKISQLSIAVSTALFTQLCDAKVDSVSSQSEQAYNETIVVTANKIDTPLFKVPGSIAVVDVDEVEKEGATELYDVLDNEPGVAVTGGAGRPQNIIIRGMTGNRISIVKDGVMMADGFGALDLNDGHGRDTFDVNSLKQIEVVKGASSSIHGSGAIGGVVVLVSKKPEDYLQAKDFHAEVGTTFTQISNKTKSYALSAFRFKDTEALVRASYWLGQETRNFKQDLYDRDIDGYSLDATIDHYLTDDLMLRASTNYYLNQAERKQGMHITQPDGIWKNKRYQDTVSTETITAELGTQHTWGNTLYDKLDTKVYLRHSSSKHDRAFELYRENLGINEYRNQTDIRSFNDNAIGFNFDATKEATFANLNHKILYGLEADYREYNRPVNRITSDWNGQTNLDKSPFAAVETQRFTAFAKDVATYGNWTIDYGLRFETHRMKPEAKKEIGGYSISNITSSEWSPSLSISHNFTPQLQGYMSYNHGYRAPSYDKVYGFVPHLFNFTNPFYIIPNLDLESETSNSYEVGSKYRNQNWRWSTAFFYTQFKNFIDIDQIGRDQSGNALYQYNNKERAHTKGVDFSVSYSINNQWSLSTKAGFVDGKDNNGQYLRSLAPLEGNVQLDFERDNLSAYLRMNWATAMTHTPTCENELGMEVSCDQTRAWQSFDTGVSVILWNDLTLSANVINLLNKEFKRYQDIAGLGKHQTSFSTEPGRYITLNAKYEF